MTGMSMPYQTTPNPLISCAETWPGKTQHGSVGLSLQTAVVASDPNKQP